MDTERTARTAPQLFTPGHCAYKEDHEPHLVLETGTRCDGSELDVDALIALVDAVRADAEHWRAQYEKQLAGTRMVDDMRMAEIGRLSRELAAARAEERERIVRDLHLEADRRQRSAPKVAAGLRSAADALLARGAS